MTSENDVMLKPKQRETFQEQLLREIEENRLRRDRGEEGVSHDLTVQAEEGGSDDENDDGGKNLKGFAKMKYSIQQKINDINAHFSAIPTTVTFHLMGFLGALLILSIIAIVVTIVLFIEHAHIMGRCSGAETIIIVLFDLLILQGVLMLLMLLNKYLSMDYREEENVDAIRPFYDSFFKGIIIWTSPHKAGHESLQEEEEESESTMDKLKTMGIRCLHMWSLIISVVAAILFLVFFAVVLGITHTSYPHTRGTIVIQGYSSTGSEVTIERDSYGIPHITADSMTDLAFGQGFAEAQDRLFQLDITRRAGRGMLAELVGTAGFDVDELGVTLQLEKRAKDSYNNLQQSTRDVLDAYVAGINHYIAEEPVLPPDYTMIFDNRTVQHFEPFEPIVAMYLLGWMLSANPKQELSRMDLLAKGHSPERVLELEPFASTNVTVLLESELTQMAGLTTTQKDANEARRVNVTGVYRPPVSNSRGVSNRFENNEYYQKIMQHLVPDTKASNNWIISGQHTDSGMPFLANDPHLTMSSPSPFYLKHLVCASCNLNAIGAGVSLIPSIVIGKTDKIAWGITAGYVDVMDFYHMTIGNNFNEYRHDGTSKAYTETTKTLKASTGETKKITVKESVYGPIINSLFDVPFSRQLCLQWGPLLNVDKTMDAVQKVVQAENVDAFVATINANVTTIPLNFVVVDSSNNTGYALSGLIPNRPHSGLFVMEGDGSSDSTGYLPRSAYPVVKNPSRGWIATANNRIVPYGYPHNLGFEYASIYRASRIHKMIERDIAKGPMNLGVLRAQQLDTVSDAFITFNKTFNLFSSLYESQKNEPAIYSHRADMLLKWDGNYSISSEAPMLFEYFLRELRVAALGSNNTATSPSSIIRVTNILDSNADSVCGSSACRGQFVVDAFRSAVAAVEKRGGLINWGLSHLVEFPSTLYDGSALKCFASRQTFNAPGGTVTVNVAPIHSFNSTLNSYHGPSYRQLITMNTNRTLGDADSFFVIPTGASGNMVSPYYDNLISLWRTGQYMNMSIAYPFKSGPVLKLSFKQ